jgi:tight adherence protein B
MKEKEIIKRRKNDLNLQFKDMLYSLSSSLSAGRSIETAFQSVLADLSILYGDNEASIIVEMECIINKIKLNETVESALIDFAERAHLEDIDNFVDVFQICKRTGGNIIEVLKNASNIINDKIEIKQEIDTLLAERRFEQKILNILPILMIILLSVSAGDYIAPVFNTVIGRLAMTLSVVLLLVAYLISKKIMDIRV